MSSSGHSLMTSTFGHFHLKALVKMGGQVIMFIETITSEVFSEQSHFDSVSLSFIGIIQMEKEEVAMVVSFNL
jgi:hypothetical protein